MIEPWGLKETERGPLFCFVLFLFLFVFVVVENSVCYRSVSGLLVFHERLCTFDVVSKRILDMSSVKPYIT